MSSHAFLLQFERERCLVRDDAQTKLLPCDPFDSNLPPSQTYLSLKRRFSGQGTRYIY